MIETRRRRRRWIAAATAALLPLAGTLTACDPCAGVISCNAAPRVGVSGQFVDGDIRDAEHGPPGVSGVRVRVTRTGSGTTAQDEATATSDATGWWSVELDAREAGPVTVDVSVAPPEARGLAYTVRGLELRATRGRGDGAVLGRWVTRPRISVVGAVVERGTGAAIASARVTVVRRGGVEVRDTPATENPLTTSGNGYFFYDVQPLTFGPLVVDLVVERAGLPTVTVPNVSLFPDYEWGPPRPTGTYTFPIGDG